MNFLLKQEDSIGGSYLDFLTKIRQIPWERQSQREKDIFKALAKVKNSKRNLEQVVYTTPFSSFTEFMEFIDYYTTQYNQKLQAGKDFEKIIRQIYSQIGSES